MSAFVTTGMLHWHAHSPALFVSVELPVGMFYSPSQGGWFIYRTSDYRIMHKHPFARREQAIAYLALKLAQQMH